MIMVILENVCMEITSGWYINSVIKTEKTVEICKLSAICRDMFCSNWITRESQKNVLVQSVQINNCSCVKKRKEKNSSLYRGCKLLLSEDWFEVRRVNCSIASISSFRVDILLSSKSIWFGAKITIAEPDDKVELREVLRPLHLPSSQYLSSRKVLKVFVICNNINEIGQTL